MKREDGFCLSKLWKPLSLIDSLRDCRTPPLQDSLVGFSTGPRGSVGTNPALSGHRQVPKRKRIKIYTLMHGIIKIRKQYRQFPGGSLVSTRTDANAIAELYSRKVFASSRVSPCKHDRAGVRLKLKVTAIHHHCHESAVLAHWRPI
jgi:hypothetical protein